MFNIKKSDKIPKWLQYSLCFILTLCFYYFFVMVVLPFFADPQVHRFEKYHRLWNWDLKQHARADFDNDGKEDLISLTGCAFLSSVDIDAIPQDQKCTANGIVGLTFKGQDARIGQKYIQIETADLSLGAFDKKLPISHSYIAKDTNENWKIFIHSNGSLKIFEVKNNGLLQSVDDVSLSHTIDEFLYSISQFFIILALPLIFLSFLFS